MQTGYDTFWMYQNNRHEPVPNLPKNDNQSYAVLPDSYKQVQNGGHPSVLNGYIPPQNNVARSEANKQQRTPHSQYMWQSSVYSVPLKPSYVNSYHQQAGFPTQSDNELLLRNFKSTNFLPVQNNNVNCDPAPIRDNQNSNAPAARIRVRDVFSLNKGTVPNEILNGNSYQKEQHGYYNFNSAYNTDSQSQFINYGRGSLPPASHQVPYYGNHQMVGHPGSTPQLPPYPNSTSFYQQNSENQQQQQQFITNRPVDRNLDFDASKANTQNGFVSKSNHSVIQKLLTQRNNQDPHVQTHRRVSSESVLGNEIAKSVPQGHVVTVNNSLRTVNPGYRDSLDVNTSLSCESSNVSNIPQIQNQPNDPCLFSNNSSNLSKPTSANPVFQHNAGQETVIKISIPHSGQSTFITLSDCDRANKNASLPCLLDANDKFIGEWDQNSPNPNNNPKEMRTGNVPVLQTCKTSLNNPPTPSSVSLPSPNTAESVYRKNLTVPPRKRFCQVSEPFLDVNKENFNEFLNLTPLSENSSENSVSRVSDRESLVRETTFQEKITQNAWELKQENARVGKKVLFEMIKREKIATCEVEEAKMGFPEEPNPSEEPVTSEVDFADVDVKGFGFLPEIPQSPVDEAPAPSQPEVVGDSESSTESLKYDLNNKQNDNSTEKEQEKQEKLKEVNYKSKIDRNKLDMLIQFLEMDDELAETAQKKEDGKPRKEIDMNHNRRKLSKTSVVKNKNNSREMIAMKSNKSTRVEIPKCSPPTAKPSSEKLREGRNSVEEKSKVEESGNSSEARTKSGSPRVVQTEREDSSEKSEPEKINEPRAIRHEEALEECLTNQICGVREVEELIRKFRILRSVGTIFCENCKLFSKIDLFWINLASAELNCLNCFKEIMLPTESNTVGCSDEKTVQKGKSESTLENTDKVGNKTINERSTDNNLKDTKGSSKPEHRDSISKSVTITLKQEPIDSVDVAVLSRKETAVEQKVGNSKEERQVKISEDKSKGDVKNGKPKRKDSFSKERSTPPKLPKEGTPSIKDTSVENVKRDQPTEQTVRKRISKEHQDASKKHETLRKSTLKEEEVAEENARKDNISSETVRKRRDSKEVSCKSPEHSKRETKADSTDKCIKKSKDRYPSSKDNSSEQATKKRTKHEHSEKSEESHTGHKSKESDSSEESRTKSSSSSEKHKKAETSRESKKRKNSDDDDDDDDAGPSKVRIVEDETKKDWKPAQRRTSTSFGKEDIERQKTKTTDGEIQSTKNSALKVKRDSLSREEGEHLSNTSKEALKEDPMYQKIKAYEQSKLKTGESTEVLRRKSKDEQVVLKHSNYEGKVEMSEKKKSKQDDGSHTGETHKRGSVITENKERKKTEEKERDHYSRKSDTASRPLKENQNTKVKNEKNKDRKEDKRSSEERKDDKKERKTSEKSARKKLESSSHKKKRSDRSEEKGDKKQTENGHRKASEKVVERYPGGKTEGGALTKAQEGKHSAHLLSKLIKKTKKLSWSLLGET